MWLSFRALVVRVAAEITGRLGLGDAGTVLRICAGGVDLVRPPWPPGALPPALPE